MRASGNGAYIYVASNADLLHKVGHSVDPSIRCRALCDALNIDFNITYLSKRLSVQNAREIEQICHVILDKYRVTIQYTTEIYKTEFSIIKEAIETACSAYERGERSPAISRDGNKGRRHPDDFVNIQTMISAEDHLRLKKLSLLTGRSLQSLGVEAWSLLLAKEGEDCLSDTKMNRSSGMRGRRSRAPNNI